MANSLTMVHVHTMYTCRYSIQLWYVFLSFSFFFFLLIHQNSFLPLPGLESFCSGQLLFAPLFADLSSSIIPPSIPPSLLLTLFPSIPFAELRYIHDSLRTPPTGKSSGAATKSPVVEPLSLNAVKDVIKAVTRSLKLAGPDLVEIACGGTVVSVSVSGAEVVGSHDYNTEQSLVARNWKLLTTSLCLAHSSLQESQLMTRNHLVGIHYTGTCTVYIYYNPRFIWHYAGVWRWSINFVL